ncbi:hypothetical protein SAMN04487943_10580 [Gracilibacillus orientalis]|uniref:DinB superfamily protein n=1 Tax=Gracilibacillus orientalis TaxID=334253 RepID=A0A1I4LKV3_9BACI|nr:DinB family protein [Gracilibacillus orientalis]SFL91615.1 hypothetical protein SAMN04487943_10580 [Gracilibacillus orientalis]
MNKKELILKQFEACHNKDTWFVSLKTAIEGVSSEQASYKSESATHSISEIVHHLYFYNLLELNRFKEIPDDVSVADNNATFRNAKEVSWKSLVSEILTTMEDWEYEIKCCDQDYLEKYSESLSYINLHNAYHIGQILQIRKLIGMWDSNNGINYTF